MSKESRRAVVIGGATGIGSGICRALVGRGYIVDLCDIDESGANALAGQFPQGRLSSHRVDVTDAGNLIAAEAAIRAKPGDIDLVFVNAGAITLKEFLESTDDDWEWLFSINLFGTVRSFRAFLPGLLEQEGRSRLCVTSSVAALRRPPMKGQTMYMATKAAQMGLASALRSELEGTNVDLSVIFPGAVASSLRAKSQASRPGAVKIYIPPSQTAGRLMSADDAGLRIVSCVEEGRPFIATHPGDASAVEAAQRDIMEAFR